MTLDRSHFRVRISISFVIFMKIPRSTKNKKKIEEMKVENFLRLFLENNFENSREKIIQLITKIHEVSRI